MLLSATGRSKRIPEDQPTPRMPLLREQVLALLSRLPQRRYHYLYCQIYIVRYWISQTHMPSEVSTKVDLLFDGSFIVKLYGTL